MTELLIVSEVWYTVSMRALLDNYRVDGYLWRPVTGRTGNWIMKEKKNNKWMARLTTARTEKKKKKRWKLPPNLVPLSDSTLAKSGNICWVTGNKWRWRDKTHRCNMAPMRIRSCYRTYVQFVSTASHIFIPSSKNENSKTSHEKNPVQRKERYRCRIGRWNQ